jgi:predicted transglutaminase-like cysteine proteinase|tara:strand:- start:2208 stop:2840 length:633 start_codon:yes stop_codon:yes gene_type:complete
MRYLLLIISLVLSTHLWAINAPLGKVSQAHQSPAVMFSKWRAMLDRQSIPGGVQCETTVTQCLPKKILSQLESLSEHNLMEKITKVNAIVNRVSYVSDKKQYGTGDYWASPLEFFDNGKGDCEDYSIAKYFALRALGVASSHMRLIIAKDDHINDFHAVLSVKVGDQFYILDNRTNRVKADIKLANLLPIYSLNESQWWLYEGALSMLKG